MRQGIRNGTLEILDGGSESVEVKIGRGTFSWVEKREIKYTHNRGIIEDVVLGNDPVTEVSFSFNWEWLSNVTGVSINDAIMCQASGWVTTGNACEPDAVDLKLTMTPEDCPDTSEVIYFSEFRTTTRNPNLREGRVHCKGTVTGVVAYKYSGEIWEWTPFAPNQNLNVLGSF